MRKITAVKKARLWYETELALIKESKPGANRFDPYVPVEVRAYSLFVRSIGGVPEFTERHFALWAAIGQVVDVKTFDKPLGISPCDVLTHLIGVA